MTNIAAAKHHMLTRQNEYDRDRVGPLSDATAMYVLEPECMPTSFEISTITEEELKKAAAENAVKVLKVVRVSPAVYRLLIVLTWKGGEHLLITARKKPREWVSFDRMMKHIEGTYGNVIDFSLSIKVQHIKDPP
jgi:hypothetical protein